MSKKNLPNLKDADNVCDCAEEAERRKRNASAQATEQPKSLLAQAWLPILGVSALVLGLFGIYYKMFSKKKCRKQSPISPGWGGAHNVVKADEDTSGLPICPCEIRLDPKKRKWPTEKQK